jgi:hypothetical protein
MGVCIVHSVFRNSQAAYQLWEALPRHKSARDDGVSYMNVNAL